MAQRLLLEEEKLEQTIKHITRSTFTVLDFIETLKQLYPEDWNRLTARFEQFGEKRKYTVNTYLSNRLDTYSQKPQSLLRPFTRYSQAKFKDYRKPNRQEQKHFGSTMIAVYKKKTWRAFGGLGGI